MGGPFRVMLTIQIAAGLEAQFERAWHEAAGVITAQRANLGHWLAKSNEQDHVYYIFSDWADERSFREFEGTEAHLEHRGRLHPYRTGGSFATMRIVPSPELADER